MSNSFFLDIFNKILKINNHDIVCVYKDEIWFGLRDILKALEYNNYKKAIKKL
jgi:prophage antirepressor-like protein